MPDEHQKFFGGFNKTDLTSRTPFVYGGRQTKYRKKRFGSKVDIDFGKVARAYIDVVIEMWPDAAGPYYDRGTLLFHLGEVQAALKDFTSALEINCSQACALSNRGLPNSAQTRSSITFCVLRLA